jgi:hypothetical protein
MIRKARKEGFALDDEEYIEGVRALAVPLDLNRGNLHAAIWVVGLKSQIRDEVLPSFRSEDRNPFFLKPRESFMEGRVQNDEVSGGVYALQEEGC